MKLRLVCRNSNTEPAPQQSPSKSRMLTCLEDYTVSGSKDQAPSPAVATVGTRQTRSSTDKTPSASPRGATSRRSAQRGPSESSPARTAGSGLKQRGSQRRSGQGSQDTSNRVRKQIQSSPADQTPAESPGASKRPGSSRKLNRVSGNTTPVASASIATDPPELENDNADQNVSNQPRKAAKTARRARDSGAGSRARNPIRERPAAESEFDAPQVLLPRGAKPSEYGVTRSRSTGRVRTRPLEFWNNEIPEYKRQEDGTRALVAVSAVPETMRERPTKRKRVGPKRKRSLDELKALGGANQDSEHAITLMNEDDSPQESSSSEDESGDEHVKPKRQVTSRRVAKQAAQRAVSQVSKAKKSDTSRKRRKVLKAPHPTKISKSAASPVVRDEPEAGVAWTTRDISALEKAYMSVPPSKPNFWKSVAKLVGKPASECVDQYQQLHVQPDLHK